jgi:hypothetical protein
MRIARKAGTKQARDAAKPSTPTAVKRWSMANLTGGIRNSSGSLTLPIVQSRFLHRLELQFVFDRCGNEAQFISG